MLIDKLMTVFSDDIGIDLGTMNTLVFVAGRGIVMEEPSVVALNKDTNKVIAVGNRAKDMLGRNPGNILTIRPMKDGVIADAEVADEMLRYFINKSRGHYKVMQPRVVIAVPYGINEVEVRAVQDSAKKAGAREVRLVEEPLASAGNAPLAQLFHRLHEQKQTHPARFHRRAYTETAIWCQDVSFQRYTFSKRREIFYQIFFTHATQKI